MQKELLNYLSYSFSLIVLNGKWQTGSNLDLKILDSILIEVHSSNCSYKKLNQSTLKHQKALNTSCSHETDSNRQGAYRGLALEQAHSPISGSLA